MKSLVIAATATMLFLFIIVIASAVVAQDADFGGGMPPVEFSVGRGNVVPVDLIRVSVIPAFSSLNLGESMQFSALCEYGDGRVEDCSIVMTWTSLSPDTISVDADTGLAVGLSLGPWMVKASLKSDVNTTN